jgi:hypothetical protein
MSYIKGMQEEMLEGELIKKQVDEEIEKDRIKDDERRNKMKENMNILNQTNDLIKVTQEQEKQMEVEEEKKIAMFAEKKDRLDR